MTSSRKSLPFCLVVTMVALASAASVSFAQKTTPSVCKSEVFAAFKPLPKLTYECPESPNDSDDKILKSPERQDAIRNLVKELEAFTSAGWWRASVDDLNACEIHGSAGELTDGEKQRIRIGDYSFQLSGNQRMRLALISDPCYQTGYGGANAFLLYRKGDRVVVTQLLDGYFSRVDNSVGIDFANLNGQQLIEISTANSFPPEYTYYYFAIDPKTKRAVPKNLFQTGNKLTNEIYSAMLMSEPGDLGLPKSAAELKIVARNRLTPSFSAYQEDEHGRIDSGGRKLRRIVYRWNGRFYLTTRNHSR
jgi:hypothetical protein